MDEKHPVEIELDDETAAIALVMAQERNISVEELLEQVLGDYLDKLQNT